jgi:hypothetical protein
MTALFDPGLVTLDGLRRDLARRMLPHLRAVTRTSITKLFDEKLRGESISLVALSGRIIELRNTLHAEETAIDRVAKNYLMGYLEFAHVAPTEPASQSQAQLAAALLGVLNDADA